ncbi:MAG: SDR family oxidoreductase [Treponema sp.]|nr:SDR family oxidoreductase [Treponema sp.]
MKALFIGGTGTISMAITKLLAQDKNWELYLLNRGNRNDGIPSNVKIISCDVNDEEMVKEKIKDLHFETVCDFIGFTVPQLERDYRIFKGKTSQFMYISSASAYQKPLSSPYITEGTPLANPYWEYSRNKIACEEFLMEKYRNEGFPVTIIRPSHTYDERSVPLGVHGNKGSWQVIKRMMDGKPVIIHGDGTSLWTMTHNSDFAKGFTGLMNNPHALGETFQITNDENLTWNQIYQTIAKILGVELKAYYVPSDFLADTSDYDFRGGLIGDKSNTVIFDNTKLKKAVPGLSMNVRFEQGVRETLMYIATHKECQTEDPEFDAYCDRVIDAMEKAKEMVRK